jgi:lantibiotic biosynthesis protein
VPSSAHGERPLLTGRDADRARDAVRAASRGFAYGLDRSSRRADAPLRAPRLGLSLASGNAGLAIVYAALDGAFPGEGHLRRASRAIERAIARATKVESPPSLWGGFSGVTWTLDLLQGRDPGEGDNAVDLALPGLVGAWNGPFDLIYGISGLAVYALERAPDPSASALLDAIVLRLGEMSERWAPGVTWRSTGGDYDLGAAHGVAGVIATLGRTCAAAGVGARTRRRARSLLDRAVAWLLAQELPRGAGSCFPYGVESGASRSPGVPSRLAWCRGDPGIAATLAVAAMCTGEREWLRAARRIAVAAAARPFEGSGVLDAGLCHGAAGVGHLFHRVYLATGDERLAEAARAWLLRAVAMRSDRARYGWESTIVDANGGERTGSFPGLLSGAGGVVLALLAATGDASPSWDRAFGVSSREACV